MSAALCFFWYLGILRHSIVAEIHREISGMRTWFFLCESVYFGKFRKRISTIKVDTIRMLLAEYPIKLDKSIMIGDSSYDY